MSQPQEPGEAQAGPLQFDRAEFADERQADRTAASAASRSRTSITTWR